MIINHERDFNIIFSIFLISLLPKNIFPIKSIKNQIDQKLSKINNQIIPFPGETVLFHQSELCRDEELKNNIQCFKEFPEPNYEVLVGESLIIKCIVANQKGRAQWRVGDRMLGFNRKMPFNPRFSMVGDEDAGDQSLKIENITELDSGEYECQVTRGISGQSELRKATRLTVLVPPSIPLIYENNNKQPSNTILITISAIPNENVNKKLILKCVSKGGQPDPTFLWFHNTQRLTDQDLLVKIIDNSIQSHLSISVMQLLNGDTITCSVHNKATSRNSQIAQQYLNTTLSISVNTLPGAPKILDVSNRIVIDEEKSVSLSCRSHPAGEPPGNLKWNWSNNSKKAQDTTLSLIPTNWVQNTIESGSLVSNITIPKIERKYHGWFLVCRLNHELLEDQTDKIQIWVEYGPSNLIIDSSIGKPKKIPNPNSNDPLSDVPIIYAQPHQKILFQCSTSKYYGNVHLSWFVQDEIGNKKFWKLLDRTKTKENIVDEGLSKTKISYFEIIHSAEKSVNMKCEVNFKDSYKLSSRIIVETIKVPSVPILKVNNDIITDKADVTISCHTIGGNPIPSLKLFKDNQEISTTIRTKENFAVELKYNFKATKSMNLEKFYCSIISPFRLFDNIKSNDLILKVVYPPTKLTLVSPPLLSVRAGKFSSFVCETDESNPASEVTWTKYECEKVLYEQEINKNTLSKCNAKHIEDTLTFSVGRWNGSFMIKSTAKILLTEKDNNNILQCSINSFPNFNINLQKIIKLNVRHPPIFRKDIQYDYVVTEGHPINIVFHPLSNPPVQTYQWLSEGSTIPHNRALRVQENSLTIIRSDVDMMRNYTITAHNEIGTGSFTFRLNVTFGARMIGPDFEEITMKIQEKEAKLVCKAQSNPTRSHTKVMWVMLDKRYNWKLLNKEKKEIVDSSEVIKCNGDQWVSSGKYRAQCISTSNIAIMSTLEVSNLVPSDMGRYQCLVNNTIESAASKIFNLNVPVGAKIIYSRRRQLSGGELGQSAKLFCWIFGYPKPKVIWYRDTSNLTLISGKKFQYEMEHLGGGLYNSILTVDFIQKSDYTNYFCQASNDLRTVIGRVQLIPSTKPDIPTDIRVVNHTYNTITIEWIQGFNGGYQQIFTISWKAKRKYNSENQLADITENVQDEKMIHAIKDLIPSTEYEIRVCSKNKKFGNCQVSGKILGKTSKASFTEREFGSASTRSYSSSKERLKSDNIVITITSISVFVFIILVINVLFISFYIRKRRNKANQNLHQNKLENSLGYMQCSNMEMYPAINTNTRGSSINEISTNNSQRSLDSIKNNIKNNIDQLHGSMAVTSQNHRIQGSMINFTPNLSTSICYPTSMLANDKVLMYPSSIDGNLQNLTSHSHTLQNTSPGQSSLNSHSLTPYSSLLHRSNIANSLAQVEIPISSTGTPLQLSTVPTLLESEPTCVVGGLLIPVSHLSDHNKFSSKNCPEYFHATNHPVYQMYTDDRILMNDKEKYPANLSYSISYSGTLPHHRQPLYSRNDSNVSVSYEPYFANNSVHHESQLSNLFHPNDSASNSSTSSNIKRYGELSAVYNKPFTPDSILLEDKLMQSFDDDILDTAV